MAPTFTDYLAGFPRARLVCDDVAETLGRGPDWAELTEALYESFGAQNAASILSKMLEDTKMDPLRQGVRDFALGLRHMVKLYNFIADRSNKPRKTATDTVRLFNNNLSILV